MSPSKRSFFRPSRRKSSAGDPAREETVIGPLIDAPAAARVREWVQEAKSGGAKLVAGNPGAGNLMPATVLDRRDPGDEGLESGGLRAGGGPDAL